AVIVGNLDRIGLGDGLALGQEVDRVRRGRRAKGNQAGGADDGVGVRAGRERAELQAARIGRGGKGRHGGLGVGENDIGEGYRAAVAVRGGGGFGDGAIAVVGDYAILVGARYSFPTRRSSDLAVIVGNLDRIGLGDGLALGQEVD